MPGSDTLWPAARGRVGRVAGGQPALPGRAGRAHRCQPAPVAQRGGPPGADRQPAQRPARRAAAVRRGAPRSCLAARRVGTAALFLLAQAFLPAAYEFFGKQAHCCAFAGMAGAAWCSARPRFDPLGAFVREPLTHSGGGGALIPRGARSQRAARASRAPRRAGWTACSC